MNTVRGALSVKIALPLLLSVVLVVGLGMSTMDSLVRGREAMLEDARMDLFELASAVARSAERASLSDSSDLASDLTLRGANRRVAVIALIDPEGTIGIASRLAWRGRPAAEVIPGFDAARFTRVVKDHQRELVEPADGRMNVLVPYDERTDESRLRNLAQGAIYAEFDLQHELRVLAHDAGEHLLRQLGVALLLMFGLGWLLRSRVTLPLQRMEAASLELAAEGHVREPLPETGPRELAELARNFNEMTRRIAAARAEVESAAARLSGVVNAAMDAIITVDAAQRIRMVNPAGAQMFGYTEEEMLGSQMEHLLPERFRGDHVLHLHRFAGSGHTRRGMGRQALVYGLRRNGQEFPAEASISRLRMNDEDLLTVILRDVTERKLAEDQIIALNDSLEERVALRTAALAEANERLRLRETELEEARARAEDASRMKSDFLANMSHEIHTPMNAIVGMTHLMLRTPLDARQQDYQHKIQQSAHHLLGIINDILDLSKIEADKLSLERIDFQVSRVLENFSSLVSDKAAAKGLELIFDVGPDVPDHVIGDPLRLGQVLINYGNNALKFTRQGEIQVSVSCVEQTSDDVLLKFQVRDTGIGIAPAQLGRLFQSFQQADTSISRQYGGTGLGLAISRRLALLMGGDVGVDSRLGEGSTFWFTARLGKSRLSAPILRSTAHAGDHRVLVVDDNATAREVLRHMLKRLGFQVVAVDSGGAALEAAARADGEGSPFEVVLLDWQMPEMDGLETARRLRGLGLKQPPHLMLVTGFGREEVMEHAKARDFSAVLAKPVNPSLLLDQLMQALYGSRADKPAADDAPIALLTRGLTGIRGARLLAVDDNEVNLQVAREILEDAGFIVDTAADGEQALARVREEAYQLILMDMQMPVLDGLAATVAIRDLPGRRDVPIVAMTANAMEQDRQRCLEAGMNDFLAKPLDPERLFEVLRQWIPAAGGLAPARPVPSGRGGAGPAQLPQEWLRISGLDTTTGMRRVLGKVDTYRALLSRFARGHRHFVSQVETALRAEDLDTARRLAHSLKGVAGNVGAVIVQAEAAALETAFLQSAPSAMVRRQLESTGRALHALLEALAPLIDAPETAAAGAPLDAGALSRVARILSAQLRVGDPAAQALAAEQAALLRTGLGDGYEPFREALRDFDFDEALRRLAPALQSDTR